MADDDEFDFSDDDFDDLPANTLDHLEASAFRATQHQANKKQSTRDAESDYGLDDGDQVVNLAHEPQYTQPQPQPQQDYAYHDAAYHDDEYGMQVEEEPPRPSQAADTNQLLQRIKKVRPTHAMHATSQHTQRRCS